MCLPVWYQGGALLVRHRGQVANFDWSKCDLDSIQWAAFYGDCEHQVCEVTAGHRVTLTYNLYFSRVGSLAQPVTDPARLALYAPVREMLRQPEFMSRGGVLGFFCHHAYAHSTESGRMGLPGALKGVDLAVFAVFMALGLDVKVVPVIKKPDGSWGGLRVREKPETSGSRGGPDYRRYQPRKPGSIFDGEFKGTEYEEAKGQDPIVIDSDEDLTECEEDDSEDDENVEGSIVGKGLHGQVAMDEQNESSWRVLKVSVHCSHRQVRLAQKASSQSKRLQQKIGTNHEHWPFYWPCDIVSNIHWMNDPAHEDFAFAHIAVRSLFCASAFCWR